MSPQIRRDVFFTPWWWRHLGSFFFFQLRLWHWSGITALCSFMDMTWHSCYWNVKLKGAFNSLKFKPTNSQCWIYFNWPTSILSKTPVLFPIFFTYRQACQKNWRTAIPFIPGLVWCCGQPWVWHMFFGKGLWWVVHVPTNKIHRIRLKHHC